MQRRPFQLVLLLGAVVAVGAIAFAASRVLGDDNSDGTPSASDGRETVAVADASMVFDHDLIDADPPSGDACCLDVIAAGDVDGDGVDDVVIGSEHADGLSWYRNPAAPTPTIGWERFPIAEGDFTTDGETADVDGDGDLDVVASSIDRNVIEWWEQIGDPMTADGWTRHELGPDFAHDLVVADLDGDGDLDVAACHQAAGRIGWFEQPDDPTAAWTVRVVDQLATEGLAAGDLDGDGDTDLAAGPAVYENDDGSATSWTRVPLAEDWQVQARAAIGDVDGDMIPDIVLAHDETEGRLSWFRGPDWVEQPIEAEAGFTHSLEVGDVDLDGDLDVFAGVMHFAGTHQVRVLLGDGGASWTPVVLADTGTHNARLVDLDGDGRLDVLGKNFDGPKAVEVWWNRELVAAVPPERPSADAGVETPLEGFRYVQVDDARKRFNEATAFFGLAFGDVDGDEDADIASGGYIYRNPGGDMAGDWDRVDLSAAAGTTVDAMLVTDVDGDDGADVIATALPDVWWLEGSADGETWTGRVVASVPATPRPNGQGYRLGDLTGDGKPEIVLSGGEGESDVWYIEIPDDAEATEWPTVRITGTATDEQVGIGDIDGDGDNDVAAGDMRDGGEFVAWFKNPGDGSADWTRHRLGEFPGVYPDRLDVTDLDGDGHLDVVVSEENGGEEPNAEVMWYRQPDDPTSTDWVRSVVVTQYTTNALDAADVDGDGDIDLVTGEHRGTKRVSIWENAGATGGVVAWTEHPVDEGKESHGGARVWDLDGDGDLEIVSIGWDEPQYLHLWVND